MLNARLKQPIKNLIAPALHLPMRRKIPQFTKPFVKISMTRGRYTVKTITNHSEFLAVLKLRFDVFHREYMKKKWQPFGYDIEPYDQFADHLAVRDDETGQIIGCYRLISSAWSSCFYSESEFDLTDFLATPGEKLELSRACIHKAHRSGVVLNLLWRGVVEYIIATGAKQLFGIPSVTVTDPAQAARLYGYLRDNHHLSDDCLIRPMAAYEMPHFASELLKIGMHCPDEDVDAVKATMPALIRTYLKAGAKICSTPAFDRRFQCIDFFTVLNTKDMTARYEKRYQLC